ncbi:hypothetical protein HHK36_026963 [Tetracentron sinense]|uniref:SHSP domain-containing protein n=1 Tax=Tetracentron sinense TaxID=13715 RepID=A0A834YLU1_TETSI|nr:hypothetical protein HHK36_026963 [Tetracentron sinense]
MALHGSKQRQVHEEITKVDQLKATLDDGVLTVMVPKDEIMKPNVKFIEIFGSSAIGKLVFTYEVVCNSVLYEVFPMSFLMEQAGGQAVGLRPDATRWVEEIMKPSEEDGLSAFFVIAWLIWKNIYECVFMGAKMTPYDCVQRANKLIAEFHNVNDKAVPETISEARS